MTISGKGSVDTEVHSGSAIIAAGIQHLADHARPQPCGYCGAKATQKGETYAQLEPYPKLTEDRSPSNDCATTTEQCSASKNEIDQLPFLATDLKWAASCFLQVVADIGPFDQALTNMVIQAISLFITRTMHAHCVWTVVQS